MSPLESRKQLLLAESELNRAQLAGDMAMLRAGMRTLTNRARSFEVIASSAAVLVTGLAAFRRVRPANAGAKSSWWQIILKGAGLMSTVWLAFRSQSQCQDEK
jgi:hypothetical protein